MTYRIEPGQEYVDCDPRGHIRIRVVSTPYPGVLATPKVDIATLTARGREIRRRAISVGSLHESGTTAAGQPRRMGYRLVRNADGSAA